MTRPAQQRAGATTSTFLTYLTDTGRADGPAPRAGDRVHLRPAEGADGTEVWSECGRLLGRLPPAERGTLAAFDAARLSSACVVAVVPRPDPRKSPVYREPPGDARNRAPSPATTPE